MLHQRYECDPMKKYVYVRIPLEATLHCRIEIANDEKEVIYTSPEFPCRCIKSKNVALVTMMGVENSGCLKSELLGTNSFRLIYRVDDKDCKMEEFVFLPMNEVVTFSFSYGTEEDFGVSMGSKGRMIYTFVGEGKMIETTWMTSPWRMTLSMDVIKKGVNKLLEGGKGFI